MQSNLDIIKKIITKKSMNIIIEKEELIEKMKRISLRFFNELCDVYLDNVGKCKYIIEVHFYDNNYYEIDISDTDTAYIFSQNILRNFVNERFIDKESIGENRNNVRHFRKDNQ